MSNAAGTTMMPGTELGHYRILQPIGSGGMGEVFRAVDTRLQRQVAIKVMRAMTGGADGAARIWREARVAARVSHPGVCQIYDVGEVGGHLFLVMELLSGQPLTNRLEGGPLPFEDAIQVTLGVLAAVGALHREQIVHRDLKPSNVFLTADGVKLVDFGLARCGEIDGLGETREDLATTTAGRINGTPRYMAPEQWTDQAADPRSDLFATGLLLFELLTGRPAFDGETMAHVCHAVISEHPPALGGSPAADAIDAVIHRALEKRPDDRYQSADGMAQAIRTAVSYAGDSLQTPVRPTTRLVVLPFRLLRPDANLEFLSFSLPDAIVGSLAGLQSLVVRSTHAGARFASSAPDLRAIASELGVDAVVCGTLLEAGGQVRVSAQLVAAPSGTILWSGTEQVTVGGLFEVQDQLARRIVESLSVPLSAREARRLGGSLPANARAYEYYLRANQVAHDPAMFTVAERLYREALAADPNYAPAWARLGRVYRLRAKYETAGGRENLCSAEEAFTRALAIDPDLSAAHNLYTYFEVESLGRPTKAMARLLERLRTSATDPELFAGLVLACRYCGLLEASVAADRQARRLDPAIPTSVAFTHFLLADWTRAREHDQGEAQWVAHWCLPMLGRTEEGIAAFRALASRPLPPLMRQLAEAAVGMLEGRIPAFVADVRAIEALDFDPEGVYLVARGLLRVGEVGEGIAILERIVERGFFPFQAFVRDPWLDPARGDAAFARLVRRAEEQSREAEREFGRLDGYQLVGL